MLPSHPGCGSKSHNTRSSRDLQKEQGQESEGYWQVAAEKLETLCKLHWRGHPYSWIEAALEWGYAYFARSSADKGSMKSSLGCLALPVSGLLEEVLLGEADRLLCLAESARNEGDIFRGGVRAARLVSRSARRL